MSTSTIKVGFNLYLNKKFDSSVLDALRTQPKWFENFKADPGLMNIIMPPSGKDGVSIPAAYREVLKAAGFSSTTFGELRNEYSVRTSPDGKPEHGNKNHSMFTSYQSSLVWNDGTCFSNDMSPLAFKYIENFVMNDDNTFEFEEGNNLFLLPADMVQEFVDEANGNVSIAYNNINSYLKDRRDMYRFKLNWAVPSPVMVKMYDILQSSGLRSLGVVADASISWDESTSSVSSMTLDNFKVRNGESFDFSEGTKLQAEDVAANHAAIKEVLSAVKPSSPFASGGWKNVKSGATTMTKTQQKKAAARGAKAKLEELAQADFDAKTESDIKEINKPVFVAELDLDDLDSSDS
jgi:hypothetical protein